MTIFLYMNYVSFYWRGFHFLPMKTLLNASFSYIQCCWFSIYNDRFACWFNRKKKRTSKSHLTIKKENIIYLNFKLASKTSNDACCLPFFLTDWIYCWENHSSMYYVHGTNKKRLLQNYVHALRARYHFNILNTKMPFSAAYIDVEREHHACSYI